LTKLWAFAETIATIKRPWLSWSLTAILFFTVMALGFLLFRAKEPVAAKAMRFQIGLPSKLTLHSWGRLALSPGGTHLAIAATGSDGVSRLWIRSNDSLEIRPLPGTEGTWPPPVLLVS
jgi:hypothetical protein